MDEARWCSTSEAARRLGCNAQTIINYIRAGILLGAQDRPRGRWRVLQDSVDRLLAARQRMAACTPAAA